MVLIEDEVKDTVVDVAIMGNYLAISRSSGIVWTAKSIPQNEGNWTTFFQYQLSHWVSVSVWALFIHSFVRSFITPSKET